MKVRAATVHAPRTPLCVETLALAPSDPFPVQE